MWQSSTEQLATGQVRKIAIGNNRAPLAYSAVLDLWQHNASFREFFIGLLADVPFAACFWETPPVTRASRHQPFEFVLVDAPALANVAPDRDTFADYFPAADPQQQVVTFPNLGHDAMLVAPCPRVSSEAYTHLTAFSRQAPRSQQHALWQQVGTVAAQRLSDRPLWLSTSGLGVYWLHVRLDSWPKYYTYHPYTRCAGENP